MRGPSGDRKIEWFSRSRSVAGKNGRGRRTVQAREEAETRKVELEAEKLAGENAQQPLQVRQLEAQIAREEAETRASEFSAFRDKVLLILCCHGSRSERGHATPKWEFALAWAGSSSVT